MRYRFASNVIAASVLGLAALSGAAHAQGRPSTLSMTCAQAQQMVVRSGAAVLSTGPTTYDRFVRDRSFCMPDESTEPTWAPTRDSAQCMVGYRCERLRDRLFDR